MKIMIVNPALGYGGITTYIKELIKCLSVEHEITVVLPDDSVSPIKEPGVKVLYHDTRDLSKKNALFFIRLINEMEKPEVVISSQGLIIPVIAPYLDDGIKVMTVSHSGKFFTSEYSAFNHKYSDFIIAASSDYNKKYLEKRYHIKDKRKVRVIYNFISEDSYLEGLHEEKKGKDEIQIIYSGGALPGKNPDLVLKIICGLIQTNLNFKFYWTGGTQLPLPKRIINRCKINDVRQFFQDDERIIFTGRIESREEFEKLLSSSNIHLMPSRNEGCSMLLLESLRSGCICLVGDYPHSNREIVEKGGCGYVLKHTDPDAFIEKLTDIISNPKEYLQLYDNAYGFYKQHLTFPVWREALGKLINEPLNHKKRKKAGNLRLSFDLVRMRLWKKNSYVREMFFLTIKSMINFYVFFLKLKMRGSFPQKSAYNN